MRLHQEGKATLSLECFKPEFETRNSHLLQGEMVPQNFTRKMRKEAWRMYDEGRKEEADKIFDRLTDTERVAKLAASRVMEKLNVALAHEPGLLSGVEEQVQWIQSNLVRLGVLYGYAFTEELMDVAYDFEDAIDDLVLRSAAKRRRRNWESCFLLIRIQKKLENIKSRIPNLPPAKIAVPLPSETPKYLENMQWSPMFSIATQKPEKAVVYPLKEKLSALLDLKELHPDAKNRARRVLDQVETLASDLRDLKSADLNDKEMAWMEQLSHVSRSGVDIIEDFIRNSVQLRKRSWIVQRLGISTSHKLADEMDQLCGKIQGLSISKPAKDDKPTTGDCYEYDEATTEPHDLTRSVVEKSAIRELDFESFADDVHAMTTRLLAADKSFCVIPVMGMKGIGKKTLAKLILNSEAVVQHFPLRAWSSQAGDNVGGILLDLVKQLMACHMEVKRCSWGLFNKMEKELKIFLPGNRSLIVLVEPVRNVVMEELLAALEGTSNGSRLIWITSEMSPPQFRRTSSDPHLLRLRTDGETWALFTHALKVSAPLSSQLEKFKENILTTCGGLPLFIVKLAEAFSREDATHEELECSISALEPEKSWSSILGEIHKLSLCNKRCLFSLTLFPENYDVPLRRLMTLWVTENLLQTECSSDDPEDVAERFLNLFIAQGMVQMATKKLNGNVKAVRLPLALRQHWLSKVQEAAALRNPIHTRSELFLGNGMIRRLVDHLDSNDVTFHHIHGGSHTSSTSLSPSYQDVISFRSFDTGKRIEPEEEIGNFLGRCISSSCLLHLLVLDLENVYKPKLPEAVGGLIQLRYLGLRSTFLDKLPSSISKLQKLETLDIKHTHISILPFFIWKLQQLRHLYLNDGFRSKLMLPSSAGSLATLQTLCGVFVDEDTRVRDVLNRLVNLRKLGITMSAQAQAVTDWVLNLTHIRFLRVKSTDDSYQPGDLELKSLCGLQNLSYIFLFGRLRNPSIVDEFPRRLIDLTLWWSQLTEDPMQSLGKLPNLKCLKLWAKSYVGKSMRCCREGFPQLRVLKLWKLDEVEEWKVEEGALQALRDLEIRYSERPLLVPKELESRCPSLKIDARPAY